MTSSNRSLPARQVLPKTYLPVKVENGNAVILRDFFMSMCPNKLTNDWAVFKRRWLFCLPAGEVDADGKSDGSELEEDPVAMAILPIKGAKMQNPSGDRMHVWSTVIRTEPTMAKPRSMPSSKSGLSQNAIRTKGCVNELLRKSSHVSATINYIIVFAESLVILHSNYCFNCWNTYRYYQKWTKIRGMRSLKRRHQRRRRLGEKK